ncbi:phospho-acceptor domain-containing protein [Dyadobacter jejuensis]|uniref:histidine kinase n=1 Tax=Dyadobacter jejuensis TaxID=1082580 RepID=A0A316ANY8_9BACT|nr:response regulator [Dyadobacter jejuensis]PWJ58854.1 phospho-acceptor domain-containing protein [Dyadobacter jejuensis]
MILIVDDRLENILPIKKILELHHYQTDTAQSGEEALKKVLQNSYSVIVMDVQMPGMDGFEVAETLSGYSKAKDIPIIFLSAVNTEKKFVVRGYESGGIDYLTKPVDSDILLLKVRTFNRLFQQNRALQDVQQRLETEIDIRKNTEKELHLRVQELYFVLEALPQLAFTVNKEGEIEYTNRHWLQYAKDRKSFPETHPDDLISYSWKRLFVAGEDIEGELRLKDRNTGLYRYFLIKLTPIPEENGIVRWVGTLTDIHSQKITHEILERRVDQRTQELLDKNTELETTNHELQQFAWVVSHDLKEPLRKIQTFNALIKDKYLARNEEAKAYLDRSIGASARMSLLISDLLDYSRLSVSAKFQRTDLYQMIQELLLDYEELITSKKAIITIGSIPEVDSIPSQIRQVFQNLISNALKFSKPDVAPIIEISADRITSKNFDSEASVSGPYCRITISDNGIGFNEKFLDRIFIIFQRLNNISDYEGTGIGLAIAKKIIDKHEGIITARSIENEGTQFIIVLPIDQTNL